MSWDTEYTTKPREYPEDGFYDARLVWLIDLGTHESTWEGITTDKRQFYIAWELIGTAMQDLRPFMVGQTYNVSQGNWGPYIGGQSNLYKNILKPWMKGEDEKAIKRMSHLAAACRDYKPCKLTISNETSKSGKQFVQINVIKPHLDPDNVPMPMNESVVYDISKFREPIIWDKIPEWCKKKIEQSKEFTGQPFIKKDAAAVSNSNTMASSGNLDEDIPF